MFSFLPLYPRQKTGGKSEEKAEKKKWALWIAGLWSAACVNTAAWADGDKDLAQFNVSLYKHL